MIEAPDKTDALALVEADHDAIFECFYKFFSTEPRSEQSASEVLEALEVHAQVELDVFYPELESVAPGTEGLASARDDHAEIQRQVDALRQQLTSNGDVDEPMWTLFAQVRKHFNDEERTLFPAARASLGAALWDIAPTMQARKDEAAGAGGVG